MSTRSWAHRPSHPAYAKAWPTIVADTAAIIERVSRFGVVIAGPHGHGSPNLDSSDGIAFNGDVTGGLAGDAFGLLAPLPARPEGIPTATAHCTTGGKPYDLAVASVLLRCALLVPEAFTVAGTGDEAPPWARRWAPKPTAVAPLPLFARAVLAELFGSTPAGAGNDADTGGGDAPSGPASGRLQVGQPVHVPAYGNWRPGTVTKLARTRVTVRYVRNADGDTDERAFPMAQVLPADGVGLEPVHRLPRRPGRHPRPG